jgi:sulfide:quinone oxidoreductase
MKPVEIVVLGAGVSGHTAAMFAKRYLKSKANVTVISPEDQYNWIPSNIWVGVNQMKAEDVLIPLAPVYEKSEVNFKQGRAVELYPEGSGSETTPFVVYESTAQNSEGQKHKVTFDFLINATGPKLNFAATPGLGPDGFSYSVCTAAHATEAAHHLGQLIEEMKRGKKGTLLIGTGHGTCTCEGAAFEYVFNVEAELHRQGVRDQAEVIYITNEAELGDFGVDGIQLDVGGFITPSSIMAESLFFEKGIKTILGAHVEKVEKNKVFYTDLTGKKDEVAFDFAMLLPPFRGHVLKSFNNAGEDITATLFSPNDFMKVDADYTPKDYEAWKAEDWPRNYQSPIYKNLFAVGIAFAPPHQISKPRKNPEGVVIAPAPPRTGMPSAVMGRVVAENIAHQVKTGKLGTKTASMGELGAACVASISTGFQRGAAVSITMSPIVPNFAKYPETGRDTNTTFGEVGRAGHWLKSLLHYMFIYKAKGKPFWWIIPE